MIFAALPVPTMLAPSLTWTSNGAATATHPAIGDDVFGSANTTAVVVPEVTATVRSAEPLAPMTRTLWSAETRSFNASGETPRTLPSTSTCAPTGSVTTEMPPSDAATVTGRGANSM